MGTDSNAEPLTGAAARAASKGACGIPPRQRPYERAFELSFDELLSREPSDEELKALGAARRSGMIRLPVLNRHLLVDLNNRQVLVENAGRARIAWALLVLHYLCADDVPVDPTEVSFGHFAQCRGYLSVFGNRIIGRFLASVGITSQRFEQLSQQLGGTHLPGPGTSFRFDVLPRVPITIVRHEGDDEFGPGANVIYRADAERLLPAEDCVVVAELLLNTLSGKPIEEEPGGADKGRD